MQSTRLGARVVGAVLALTLLAAACGDDDSDAATDTAPEPASDMDMDGTNDADHAMEDMNMGDPDATPAADVDDAELVSGEFELLDTRPRGTDDVTGTADVARHDGGTTVTIELDGLEPGDPYIAHLHDGPCSENGGDHYAFDPDGPPVPPNEIHLRFDADEDGGGFMTAENDMTAGDDAISVVVHPFDLQDNKIACAELG